MHRIKKTNKTNKKTLSKFITNDKINKMTKKFEK